MRSISRDTLEERRRRPRRFGALLLLLGTLPAVVCDEGRSSPAAPTSPFADLEFGGLADSLADSLTHRIEMVSGNGQMGQIGAVLLDSLVVRVTNGAGAPVDGATVFWDVLSGTGELSGMGSVFADVATRTGATGLSEIRLTLGSQPGVNQVKARSFFSTNQVVFAATGTSP